MSRELVAPPSLVGSSRLRHTLEAVPVERPSPLFTASGVALGASSIGLAIIGVILGYRELLVLAVTGGLLLVAALVVPRVASPLRLERRVLHKFVPRGDDVVVALHVEAVRPVAPMRVVDHLAGVQVSLPLPRLEPETPLDVTYRLQALRRGVHMVGPLREERRDRLGLAIRTIDHDVTEEVWVHPVLHRLVAAGPGTRLRQEQRAALAPTDDPLAEFRTLREYVAGDDPRRIHWPSSARTGQLVVREQTELRRPTRYVVLETVDDVLTDGEFEEAVEIAASLAVQGIADNLQVAAATRDPGAPGRGTPVWGRQELLELYTLVTRTPASKAIAAQVLLRTMQSVDHVFLVSGGRSPLNERFVTSPFVRRRLAVVRVTSRPESLPRLPVRTYDVRSAEEFVARFRLRRTA
jgi:uncharacterized protein (DUF58 family)